MENTNYESNRSSGPDDMISRGYIHFSTPILFPVELFFGFTGYQGKSGNTKHINIIIKFKRREETASMGLQGGGT